MNIRWSINKSNIINCILALSLKALQEAANRMEKLEKEIKLLKNRL
jgi:hypothetical protein